MLFQSFLLSKNLDLKKQYLEAKSQKNQYQFKESFEDLFMQYPDTYYGQLSLLELGKIELLKRDYNKAISYLKQIHHPDISEKEFWLAEAYLKNKEFDTSIIASQNYIFDSDDPTKIELSYFLIAESYIEKKNFTKAISTLDYLKNSEFIHNNIPLLHFKLGYCYEKKKEIEKALLSFRKLKIDFPYSQYTYQAEERIKNLGNPTLEIDVIESDNQELIKKKKNVIKENKQTGSLRYLQVGVFSSKKNADKMSDRINTFMKGKVAIFPRKNNGDIQHVVAVGPFDSDSSIKIAKEQLSNKNISTFEIKK